MEHTARIGEDYSPRSAGAVLKILRSSSRTLTSPDSEAAEAVRFTTLLALQVMVLMLSVGFVVASPFWPLPTILEAREEGSQQVIDSNTHFYIRVIGGFCIGLLAKLRATAKVCLIA
mmetsp:Transcript_108749/g.249415  ORF Transcript_108749/g.249415 Transcript_108749/m.249415 type:complete len:117 (+) Transcript_108749:193-543(+)